MGELVDPIGPGDDAKTARLNVNEEARKKLCRKGRRLLTTSCHADKYPLYNLVLPLIIRQAQQVVYPRRGGVRDNLGPWGDRIAWKNRCCGAHVYILPRLYNAVN